MTDVLETWYAALGMGHYQVSSDDDHWLTLTYFTSWSLRLLCGKTKSQTVDFKHTRAFGSLLSL